MLVMDAITEILKREGISTMFCFPTTPIIETAVAAGMRPVICRQERVGRRHGRRLRPRHQRQAARRLRDAVRARGRERFRRHRHDLFRIRRPVLLLPLGHPRETAQIFPLFSSTRTYASVTKQVEAINMPEHTVPAMRRAFNALKNGRARPGHGRGAGRRDDRRVRRQPRSTTRPIRPSRSAGDPRDIDEAAKLLLAAKSPIDPRRPGRAVRRGDRRARCARRPACRPRS